jgi:putative chitinase
MELKDKYKTLFEKSGLTTKIRVAHFMAQIEHESNLLPISENLNYSKAGLLKTFRKYFTPDTLDENKKIVLGTASLYARKPEKIANRVYANRIGNGNEASLEGWKYRGRGFLQITGKANYFRLANDKDLDCLKNPDLLLEEANALIAALWFWDLKGLNKLADKNDINAITKIINGGFNGLQHRKELLKKYMAQ